MPSPNKPQSVASVAAFNAEGRMLWGRRGDNQRWSLPGGHLDDDESPEKGAVRELLEETGLTPTSLEFLGKDTITVWGGKEKTIHCFWAEVEGEPNNENDPDDEFSEFKWVFPDDIPSEIMENLHSPRNVTLQLLGLQEEELAKAGGAMGRLAPFKPSNPAQRLPPKAEATVASWQNKENPSQRDQVKPMEGPARTRALHKLSGQTVTRVHPTTGQREFLLHRGADAEEKKSVTSPGAITHPDFTSGKAPHSDFINHTNKHSSWTPKYETAEMFGDRFHPLRTTPPKPMSAWVPESHISMVPKQYGNMSEYAGAVPPTPARQGKNSWDEEHEVIVAPGHNSRVATPEELRPVVNPGSTLDGRINAGGEDEKQLEGAENDHASRIGMTRERMAHRMTKAEETDPLHSALPIGAKLYNMVLDDLELRKPEVRNTFGGPVTRIPDLHEVGAKLKRLGYMGYSDYRELPGAIALFRQPPIPTQDDSGFHGVDEYLLGQNGELKPLTGQVERLLHHPLATERLMALKMPGVQIAHLEQALGDSDPQVAALAQRLIERTQQATLQKSIDTWIDGARPVDIGLPEVVQTDNLPNDPPELREEKHSETVSDMLGISFKLHAAFEAARFLANGSTLTLDQVRRALWADDGDVESAALRAYGIPLTEENRKAIQAILTLAELRKSEATPSPETKCEAALPEGKEFAEDVLSAYQNDNVHPVSLKGRHSKGSMVAKGASGKTYLLKPGSGGQSIAAGANQDSSTQSEREACYWQVANHWGIGFSYPEAQLLVVNDRWMAAIELLPPSFRSVDVRFQESPHKTSACIHEYVEQGVAHKWAAVAYVLGNSDEHNSNSLMSQGFDVIKLIDHGSAFAGSAFDPPGDQYSFVPYYLRASCPKGFNILPVEEKLRYMPRVNSTVAESLALWIAHLDPVYLGSELTRYGIDPGPSVTRLHGLQEAVKQGPCDLVINTLWVQD